MVRYRMELVWNENCWTHCSSFVGPTASSLEAYFNPGDDMRPTIG